MAKRISPTAIGVFVVASLSLLLITLVVLGSGRFFQQQHRFVCFFTGSLNGLRVGAAVKVRGVAIGQVSQILLQLPRQYGIVKPSAGPVLPVFIEIDETQLKRQGANGQVLQPDELQALIKRGMRAQLNIESILTGLLFIDLDFYPHTPVTLVMEHGTATIPEIPTIPSSLEQVQETAKYALAKFEKIDFQALAISITNAANAANTLLSSPDLKATLASLRETVANLNITVTAIRKHVDILDTKTDPVLASMKKASDEANVALIRATSVIDGLQTNYGANSPTNYRLNLALENLSTAATAIRQLADYLQRNPSAVIRGQFVPDQHR